MNTSKGKGAFATGAASGIGNAIGIDGGSLTRGYPALLTGVKKAS